MAKNGKDGKSVAKMEGNTKLPRCVPGKYWAFTLNNYEDDDVANLAKKFTEKKLEYLIGEEIGEEGTPHLQGFLRREKIMRPMEMIGDKRIHWEKCGGSEMDNQRYCMKDGKYVTNMRVVKDVVKERGALDWQEEIIELCDKEPDDRSIHWYWDEEGNIGKTKLAIHLALKYGKRFLYVNGKASDIKCAIAQMKDKPKVVVWGIPRTKQEYVDYAALEEVKDGIFFSGKYESGMVIYPNPHVIVLCNFPPETNKLSADRWIIKNLRA